MSYVDIQPLIYFQIDISWCFISLITWWEVFFVNLSKIIDYLYVVHIYGLGSPTTVLYNSFLGIECFCIQVFNIVFVLNAVKSGLC